jgi:hypothetical protein
MRRVSFIWIFLLTFSCVATRQKKECIEGIAADAKRSAVVLTDRNIPYYIDNLANWPPDMIVKRVIVKGVILRIENLPDSSLIQKQEISGSYYLIKEANYKVIKN